MVKITMITILVDNRRPRQAKYRDSLPRSPYRSQSAQAEKLGKIAGSNRQRTKKASKSRWENRDVQDQWPNDFVLDDPESGHTAGRD